MHTRVRNASVERWISIAAFVAAACVVAFAAAGDEKSTVIPAPDLSGCWEGTWQSCVNGHSGKLRAVITKVGDNAYCARFSGTFYQVLPFRYRALLTAAPAGDQLRFEGERNLGPLAGGVFHYSGTTTAADFTASYCSNRDNGMFVMTRVQSWGCCSP